MSKKAASVDKRLNVQNLKEKIIERYNRIEQITYIV